MKQAYLIKIPEDHSFSATDLERLKRLINPSSLATLLRTNVWIMIRGVDETVDPPVLTIDHPNAI